MIPLTQTVHTDDDGNCLAASICSILELDIDTFPVLPPVCPDWDVRTNEFLNSIGYHLYLVNYPMDKIKGYHIIIGTIGKDRHCVVLIMSLRSGIGVDGLQDVCYTVVHGELDWSPKVHDQFTARVDRDGNTMPVDVFYTVVEEGSDPVVMDVLGLKASQAHGIVDPLLGTSEQLSDESNMRKLAQHYLDKKRHHHAVS